MKLFAFTTVVTLLAGLFAAGVALGEQRDEAQLRVPASQLTSDQVRELQQSLKDHGVDPGAVDGKMGSNTRQAIQRFQRQEDLAATGDINEPTLEALGIEVQQFMGMSPEFAAGRDEAELQITVKQLNPAQVRELQRALKEHGLDPGPVDGKMGSRTQQALQRFQRQEDLAARGDVNERTLEALDIDIQEFMGLSPQFD